ncbi:hypothetical protein SDJN03_14974, partial [Cucurbita argyrosperma subsp. sororia]
MVRGKRKCQSENDGKFCEKKTKNDETTAAAEKEPTDEEVEEFYSILRRMKRAAEYFGVEKGMLTKSLRDVAAAAADREEKEEEKKGVKRAEAETDVARMKQGGKGKEVVAENGLRLDLNIAVAVESDGR